MQQIKIKTQDIITTD